MQETPTDHSQFQPLTDAEIAASEEWLGISFHPDYRAFLKGGCDLGQYRFQPAVTLPGAPHLDPIEIAQTVWAHQSPQPALIPFLEQAGRFFCLSPTGEVFRCSHDAATTERWPSLEAWRQQVSLENG